MVAITQAAAIRRGRSGARIAVTGATGLYGRALIDRRKAYLGI
jgi:hypothetical protein